MRPGRDPNATPAPRPTKRPKPGQSAVPGGAGAVVTPVPTAASAPAPAPFVPIPGRGAVQRLGRTLVTEVGGRDTSVVVLWPDRSVIAASVPIPDVAPWPVPTLDEVDQAVQTGEPVRRIDGGRSPRAMLVVDTIQADDGTVLAVTAVATSLETGDAALAQLRIALIVGILAAILLGVGLGLPITRIALRPLDRVVGVAERISAGDRGVRVGTTDVPVEIARLGEAFDTMVDRLEASAEAQRRFVADASHELRTPLAALGGMTEMLLLGIDQGDEAAVERVLTAMNREIGRLGRLAADLLALSQLEDRGGRLPLVYVDVPVAEVAGEVVSELGPVLGERQVDVSVAPEGLVVAGDRDRLKQVLLNLVENSARHTEAGGSIVISADSNGDLVRISVSDNGVGPGGGRRRSRLRPVLPRRPGAGAGRRGGARPVDRAGHRRVARWLGGGVEPRAGARDDGQRVHPGRPAGRGSRAAMARGGGRRDRGGRFGRARRAVRGAGVAALFGTIFRKSSGIFGFRSSQAFYLEPSLSLHSSQPASSNQGVHP